MVFQKSEIDFLQYGDGTPYTNSINPRKGIQVIIGETLDMFCPYPPSQTNSQDQNQKDKS
jgi:hypothetical protein